MVLWVVKNMTIRCCWGLRKRWDFVKLGCVAIYKGPELVRKWYKLILYWFIELYAYSAERRDVLGCTRPRNLLRSTRFLRAKAEENLEGPGKSQGGCFWHWFLQCDVGKILAILPSEICFDLSAYLETKISLIHQNEGGIGKIPPNAQQISWDQSDFRREISRAEGIGFSIPPKFW